MKFVTVFSAVFMASCLVEIGLSSSTLKLTGNASVEFYGPLPEDFWASLSKGHRYPILNSGDVIALRLAYSSSHSYAKYWLYCSSSYCQYYTCAGTSMTAAKWSSCSSNMMFKITAKGKMDGQPINSGDTVMLASKAYSYSYRLYCGTSSSTKCRVLSSSSSITPNQWLTYDYLTFQIYSKQADDGTPVQLGDIVGFKYPYGSNSAWLYYYGSYFYERSCSSNSKSSCARENCPTGFEIYKQPA